MPSRKDILRMGANDREQDDQDHPEIDMYMNTLVLVVARRHE